MSEEIKAVNARLKELSSEFQDLSALKKKLMATNNKKTIKDKYGDYKYIVKRSANQDIDWDKLIADFTLKFSQSRFGMLCVTYAVGEREVSYHVARTEEECEHVRAVQRIFDVGTTIEATIKNKKIISATEIIGEYDNARIEHKLPESEEPEEVPSN